MRRVLRRREEYTKTGARTLFPYVPWERGSKVAVDVHEKSKPPAELQHPAGRALLDSGLDRILSFPPLLQEFEKFCLKALCIEVRPTPSSRLNVDFVRAHSVPLGTGFEGAFPAFK